MSRTSHPSSPVAATLLAALLLLAGCGTGGDPNGVATSGTDSPTTLDITVKGGTVEPHGAMIKVTTGKPLTLHIVADEPGELHVHSSPEQEIKYAAGTTDKTLRLEQPGVVDVESHTLDTLVAQLEVR